MPSNPLTPLQQTRKELEDAIIEYGNARADANSLKAQRAMTRCLLRIQRLVTEAQTAIIKTSL